MSDAAPAIRCQGLVKQYSEVRAVAGIDLQIARGECFGLLGPNGAGKTTTIEILEGLTEADGGSVEILGQRWAKGRDRWLRQRIGVQLQDTQLGDKLTVEEVLELFRSLYDDGCEPEELLRLFELEGKRGVRFHKLSGGQKQRVTLACALVSNPEILFLDEPTTGLDPQARQKVWGIVRDYKRRGGTVLITTHYMEEAAQLCDRLAIMDHGHIIALGSPAELVRSLGAEQVVELEVDPPSVDLNELPAFAEFKLSPRERDWVFPTQDITQNLPRLLELLSAANIRLKALRTHEPTLDDVFLALTGKALRDA